MLDSTEDIAKKRFIVKKLEFYQKVEHNTTIARARSAKQYSVFLEEKDIYPNIKWLPSRSADPRELHRTFYGKVLPVDHPFWKVNFPGNLWNCKCDWTHTDEPTTDEPKEEVKASQGLEGNPSITGEIFSKKTTWFKKVGEEGIKQAERDIKRACVKQALKSDLRKKVVPQIINGKSVNIEFNRNSIEHFASDYFPNTTFKDLLISNLDLLVTQSVYFKSKINIDNLKIGVKIYHYFEIKLNGEYYILNISEWKNGKFYFHAITKKIERN